jgi:hypothetical protein
MGATTELLDDAVRSIVSPIIALVLLSRGAD